MEILAAQEDGASIFPVDDGMAPYFIVSRPDQNDRQDGRGRFLRIYPYNAPAVQVTAQDTYGSLGFYKWIENGQSLGANHTLSISTTIDHRIIAQYVSLLPVRITASRAGGQIILSWEGGVGAKLQKRSCLADNCSWQDVQGTDGLSSFAVTPLLTGQFFFRLVRVR